MLVLNVYGNENEEAFLKTKCIFTALKDLKMDLKVKINSSIQEKSQKDCFQQHGIVIWSFYENTPAKIEFLGAFEPFRLYINSNFTSVSNKRKSSQAFLLHPKTVLSQSENGNTKCLRLFISGDRKQVGKSTVCLGLIGSLLRCGYTPNEIAYIKPATQCTKSQLVTRFCEEVGIKHQGTLSGYISPLLIDLCKFVHKLAKVNLFCSSIGPIVFYKGFTREYLNDLSEKPKALNPLIKSALIKCDEMAYKKRILIIDGVGYPSVGSVCAVSNADIAKAVQAPALLVGKKGVGDAIDSYNINSAFFEAKGVPVLGAIFNQLPVDGYYSLQECKKYIGKYFAIFKPEQHIFGYLPELTCLKSKLEQDEMSAINLLVDEFMKNINMQLLLDDIQGNQFGLPKDKEQLLHMNKRIKIKPVDTI